MKTIVKLERKEQVLTVPNAPFSQNAITPINQPTELGESLRELNSDKIDIETRMSDIDMRSRLYQTEVSAILALDSLVSLGVLPVKCLAFSRSKKRLAVSLEGKGRQEIVDVVAGKRELEQKSGFSGFMSGMKERLFGQ